MIEQTDYDRIADLIRWRNLGRPMERRESLFPEHLLCTVRAGDGHPCALWGPFMHRGRRFCRHHAPQGAVRR